MRKVMKKAIWMTALLLCGTTTVWAKSDQMIHAEAKKNIITIAQVQHMPDEAGVTLTGEITRHLSAQGDDFELKDATGSIVIDVDDDHWRLLQLKAGDTVRIIGEVDTHRNKPTEIDVIYIERVKRN